MKVLILAAGEGKRIKPIQTLKSLFKFSGKQLILHKMDIFERAGFKKFVVVCSPEGIEEMKKIVGQRAEYVIQYEAKGTGDAILCAKDFLKDEEVIITNAEDAVEASALKELNRKDCDACLVGKKVSEYFPGGYFKLKDEKLVGIVEKPGAGNEPSDLVSIGLYLFRKFDKFVEYLESAKTSKDDQLEVAMDKMMKDGFIFKASKYDGEWLPFKYPWHVFNIMNFYLRGKNISKKAAISKSAVIEGDVFIEDGVKIGDGAIIKGPCYIGRNSIVGTNVLVRNSMIGENCVVGFSSEVARSYIADGTMMHMSYVGDSIIMNNCNLGAGTITANWRFDNKEVKINVKDERISSGLKKFGCIMGESSKTGIHVSIMPGVKIGNNVLIGANVLVTEDIESKKFIKVKQEQIVVDNNV